MRRKDYIRPKTKVVPVKCHLLLASQEKSLQYKNENEQFWKDPGTAD